MGTLRERSASIWRHSQLRVLTVRQERKGESTGRKDGAPLADETGLLRLRRLWPATYRQAACKNRRKNQAQDRAAVTWD